MSDYTDTAPKTGGDVLLRAEEVQVHFSSRGGLLQRSRSPVRAVDGVSFDLKRGETLGLVGESGCGKSTLGRALLRLVEPTGGRILFDGTDLTALSGEVLRRKRRQMQLIFQDPYASLNPRTPVRDIVAEPMVVHGVGTRESRSRRITEVMDLVGLPTATLDRYPHEFSGGQRQRIGIARALVLQPDLVVCDEPVSALDVSIQSQVLNLMKDIQRELGLTMVFISHDLGVVKHVSDRVAVMYLGKFVEVAGKRELYADPRHPYTKALFSAIPIADPDRQRSRERITLSGDLPSPSNPPSGCAFRTRCPTATPACAERVPQLVDMGPSHTAADCVCVVGPEGVEESAEQVPSTA